MSGLSVTLSAVGLSALLACTGGPPVTADGAQAPTNERRPSSAGPARGSAPDIDRVAVKWSSVRSGFIEPTQVTSAPDGTNRMFVVQKGGRVKVVAGGRTLKRQYLNISGKLTPSGEGGLLSIAFSPSFRRNGLLFVAYSRRSDGDLVVARMRAQKATSTRVRSSTLRPVLRVEHSEFDNHYGGQLAFGPDGFLYVGTGDGGGGGNELRTAGNRNDLRGKILRIDVQRSCGSKRYCSPRSNPYVKKPGRDEIWLLGLRNPWRFSFDVPTRTLWIGDVGQDAVEEIDRVAAAPSRRNLGWSCREGDRGFDPSQCRRKVRYLAPVATVDHPFAESITGGFVYRGSKYAKRMGGVYVFGDFQTRRVWLYHQGQGKAVQRQRLGGSAGPTSFGVDDRGEIYAVSYDGTLWRMRVAPRGTT